MTRLKILLNEGIDGHAKKQRKMHHRNTFKEKWKLLQVITKILTPLDFNRRGFYSTVLNPRANLQAILQEMPD